MEGPATFSNYLWSLGASNKKPMAQQGIMLGEALSDTWYRNAQKVALSQMDELDLGLYKKNTVRLLI